MSTRILVGDVRERLAEIPNESIHCCITSPPYFGLRDYGASGQIGLEASPAAYIETLVSVFREVYRVLRKDGTLWLNLGSSYMGGGSHQGDKSLGNVDVSDSACSCGSCGICFVYLAMKALRFKQKDLMLIPDLAVLALQADGWYLRSEITWCKKSCMPESVNNRPTSATEKIFLLTKSSKYFYDADAVRDELSDWSKQALEKGDKWQRKFTSKDASRQSGDTGTRAGANYGSKINPMGRNMRNFWLLGPEPFPEAHFATFVTEIPRRAILAGTSERGVCRKCNAPWARVTETEKRPGSSPTRNDATSKRYTGALDRKDSDLERSHSVSITIDWSSTCEHGALTPIPATVLDPFFGAGTTGLVADQLGRDCIGIELNPTYAEMARKRIQQDAGMFGNVNIA